MNQCISKQRRMFSTPEAASYCGSSAFTLVKLRLYGGGPVFLKLSRRVVYNPDDFDAWFASRRRTSTSDEVAGMKAEIIAKVFGSGWFIRSAARATDKNEPNCDNAKRCQAARGIWQSVTSARSTLVLANKEHKDVASENEGEGQP